VVDVLNAAWIARVAQADMDSFALRRMGGKFEKICQQIVGKGSQ
jgi:hypothetical protein